MTDDAPGESDAETAPPTDGRDSPPDDGVDPATVRAFLDDADAALAEYDRGYADADATLRVLRRRLDDLREAVGE